MTDIILHHYPLSPYSEKVRLALGLKGLAWRSVDIPVWMPRPDLMPLTGGYRRTPVMQAGADVYCDTLLILREIDRRHPERPLYPRGQEGIAAALGWWAEKCTFVPAIGTTLAHIGDRIPEEMLEERRPFFGWPIDKASMAERLPLFRQRLRAHLGWLGSMLADGRPFVLGDAPTAADLCAYHPVWFARKNGGAEVEGLLPLTPLAAWYDRVGALGHGRPEDLDAPGALEIAAGAEPETPSFGIDPADPLADLAGRPVSVSADDYGSDPVTGELVACSDQEIVVRRRDPRAGEVNVHFPRAGFDAAAA